VRPDYHGGSIVNLMASIVTAFGGRSDYELARDLAPAEIASARNVVLVVLDTCAVTARGTITGLSLLDEVIR